MIETILEDYKIEEYGSSESESESDPKFKFIHAEKYHMVGPSTMTEPIGVHRFEKSARFGAAPQSKHRTVVPLFLSMDKSGGRPRRVTSAPKRSYM